MMFWLAAAMLVIAVAIPLLLALRPKLPASGAADFDVDFYRLRRQEIERQAGNGEMTPGEARLALAEAGRRLLAVKADAVEAPVDAGRGRLASLLVLLILPAVALPVYLISGQPGLSAKPYATRTDLNRAEEDLARLVAKLDTHLAESPDDAKGFELALPVYMRLGRFESAVHAAERLIALRGETPERLATLAEALIFNGRGIVGEQAAAAVEKALAGDPKLARARFYRGLAQEQAGQPDAARAIWQALAGDLPDGQEKSTVRAHIARLAARPAGEAADAIRSLPEGERRQAIVAMVEGLAGRLQAGGGSAEEWLRLVRARAVLGDREAAVAALAGARADLAGREGLDRIEALALELGLTETRP